jgi:hypothetical protein
MLSLKQGATVFKKASAELSRQLEEEIWRRQPVYWLMVCFLVPTE